MCKLLLNSTIFYTFSLNSWKVGGGGDKDRGHWEVAKGKVDGLKLVFQSDNPQKLTGAATRSRTKKRKVPHSDSTVEEKKQKMDKEDLLSIKEWIDNSKSDTLKGVKAQRMTFIVTLYTSMGTSSHGWTSRDSRVY